VRNKSDVIEEELIHRIPANEPKIEQK